MGEYICALCGGEFPIGSLRRWRKVGGGFGPLVCVDTTACDERHAARLAAADIGGIAQEPSQ